MTFFLSFQLSSHHIKRAKHSLDLKFCVSIGGFLRDCILVFKGFPGGAEVKASACNVGDLGSIPGSGRSPGEGRQPAPVFLPGEAHGRRSLVGYSPRVAKGRTRLSDFTFTFKHSLKVKETKMWDGWFTNITQLQDLCIRSRMDPLSFGFPLSKLLLLLLSRFSRVRLCTIS